MIPGQWPVPACPPLRPGCDNAPVLAVLLVTFPFFALVLCGYLAVRAGVLAPAAIPGLNSFVLFFALPCMLYRFGARTPIAQLLDPLAAGLYLLCALLLVAAVVAFTRARLGWNDAAFGALVAVFPNTGFMGVPLLVALLGAQAAGPVILTVALDMLVTTSLCLALSRLGMAQGGGAMRALRHSLAGMLGNPMPWAIALGALASALQWRLPGPLAGTVDLLADAASPVALFTIGAVLARSQQNQHERVLLRDYLPLALVKLLLHPLLVWWLGLALMGLGWRLDPAVHVTLTLAAALPSASNVSLLAERFGAHNGRIARIILASTVLAFGSFALAVQWLTRS